MRLFHKHAPGHSRSPCAALYVTAALLPAIVSIEASAAEPTATDFGVLYQVTDENGDVSRRFTSQDMANFVNKARCECGQTIETQISLLGSGVDSIQIETYVGNGCATGQSNPSGAYDPCARLTVGLPSSFQSNPSFTFDPLWLSSGTNLGETGGPSQDISEAVPSNLCEHDEGTGGLWMCSGVQGCVAGDFFMEGESNINLDEGSTPRGISYDFNPPVVVPTDFKASAGDGAVKISWNITTTAAINGYRILCATADGAPIDNGKAIKNIAVDRISDGTLYYTRDNLCPGGRFGSKYNPTGEGWPDEDDEDSTEPDTGTDDTETGSGSGSDDVETNPDSGGGETETSPDEEANSILLSLDWGFVCSDHIGGTSTQARITGLTNDTAYQFLVVAYDMAGNPVASDAVVRATPVATSGLWDLCEEEGDVCGEANYCNLGGESPSPWAPLGGLAICTLFFLKRRERAVS